MAQGKVVKTPTLSTVRPVAPFKEMPTMGLSPDTSFAPDPGIPATMFAMPPDGGNPFQLDVAPPPMDFSNVSGNGDFGGVMPDGIFSPAEIIRRRQEAEDKIQKAVLRPYLDLSQIPMEQMLPVPDELPYTSDKPAMAAAGVMGLLGGGFGARAGANAAARYTQAADAVRKEREARDFARNQLQNELIQQRNQMALKKGDLQNDDIARYNQEQLRRESSERDLLERRFATESKAYERQQQEITRRQIAEDRRIANEERIKLEREKEENKKVAQRASQLYGLVSHFVRNPGALKTQADRDKLTSLIAEMNDPKYAQFAPQFADMTAEARQKLALQKQVATDNKAHKEAQQRHWVAVESAANSRIAASKSIARGHDDTRRAIANLQVGKNSTSSALKSLSVRSTTNRSLVHRADGLMRQSRDLTHEASMMFKGTGADLDSTYVDRNDPRLNGTGPILRGRVWENLRRADEAERQANTLYQQAAEEDARIRGELYNWQQMNGGAPAQSNPGQGGKGGSNVDLGRGLPRRPGANPVGGSSGYIDPAKALDNINRGILEAEKKNKR